VSSGAGGKAHLHVLIDEKLLEEFKAMVARKYPGVFRGVLSAEVQNALAHWLRLQHTQIHAKPVNPGVPLVHRACREIVDRLKAAGYLNQVSWRVLEETIAEVRGSDRRTIEKWWRLLLKHGYLKQVGTYIYEIL